MALFHILPFDTPGGQIPALHDLKRNAHKMAFMGRPDLFFKPGKIAIVLSRYPKWLQWLKAVNNKAAWKYLNQQTSGVIQNNGKIFQPAAFATAPFAADVVNVLSTFTYGPDEWASIRYMDIRSNPPGADQIGMLMAAGLLHRYVAEGKDKPGNSYPTDGGGFVALYPAPKSNGNVWVPILSNEPVYINMSCLVAV